MASFRNVSHRPMQHVQVFVMQATALENQQSADAKTKVLISAFVFATKIVQFLFIECVIMQERI